MSYQKAIKYLESFINYERISDWGYKESFKLDSFKDFLNTINNPQNNFPSVHIAGSKGKGSTCAFISCILREAGYKIGLYTSPHLVDFRERIRILERKNTSAQGHKNIDCFEGQIPKAKLVELVEKFKPAIDKYNRISKYTALSFFEVYTALAFVYFKEEKIDFAVIETGLGGRLDATNVVNSLVCAVTPISYEHTHILGNTLREIAGEKAGIIKSHKSPPAKLARSRQKFWRTQGHKLVVVTAPQEKEALDVIKNRCRKVGAKLFEVGKDIICKKIFLGDNFLPAPLTMGRFSVVSRHRNTFLYHKKTKNGFTVKGRFGEYSGLKTKLLGGHQLMNATVAIGVIEALRLYGLEVGIDAIQKGVSDTFWPGRCEVVPGKPVIVLDGAQNAASAAVLKKAVKESFNYRRLILVLGISNDKDKKGICGQLSGLADEIILTQSNNPRAASADDIEKIIKAQGTRHKIIKTSNVESAMKKAKAMVKNNDLILITGSLFVVGEARQLCKI